MSKPEQDRAKQLLDSVLANTHESLKWSWQVVMGFALYTAVQETYTAFTGPAPMPPDELGLCLAIAVLAFLPTFIRFFYGDNRYLDLHEYADLGRKVRRGAVKVGVDDALSRRATSALGRLGDALLAQDRERLVDVAAGLLESALAVHHPGA